MNHEGDLYDESKKISFTNRFDSNDWSIDQ